MPTAIIGLGSALPEKILTNDDLSRMVETNDEWIFSRTGISQRHVARDENVVTIGVAAAEQAIEAAKIDRQKIDLCICATLTPHYCAPPNAAEIRKRLGIENAVAFDMNAQCTGFIFSCAVAHSMMKTLGFKNALVIGSEILSKLTDWTDRTTCILYGDGAGAAILSDSEDSSGIKSVYLEGSNDFDDSLVCLSALNDSPFAVPQQANTKIQMKGGKVFTYAVGAMKRSVNKVLESSGFSLDDIKWIIPHQANLRIITSTANRLNVEMDRFFVNIDHTGNTSSATIPIALHELYNTGQLQKGDLIILTGFGAGLAAGALLLEW